MTPLSRPPTEGIREAPFSLVSDPSVDGQLNDGLTLDGYGAVFNSPTVIDSFEGRFVEVVAPGSMKRSFRENPPRIQYDHGRHPLIGSIPIASLQSAREDTHPVLAPEGGAHIIARLLDNWLVQPVRDAIAANAINGMSFRFEVMRETWAYADGTPIKDDKALMVELEHTWDGSVPDEDLPIRTLRELKVAEIGPVMWAAYSATSIGVRKGTLDLDRLDDPEQRKLLARAMFTMPSSPSMRGTRPIDIAAQRIHEMMADIAARRERVKRYPPDNPNLPEFSDRRPMGWRR